MNTNIEPEPKSKTQLKRDMQDLQALGEALVKLPIEQLLKIQLDELLLDAIYEAKRLSSHGAIRRQLQYIGKLMRSVDAAPIKQYIDNIRQQGSNDVAKFHQLEDWRERLIRQGDEAIAELLKVFPDADRQALRQLVRNAQKQQQENAGLQYSRQLFRFLRELFSL